MLEMSSKKFFIQPIKNRFFLVFVSIHLAFIFIFDKLFGKSFFLAPDEKGYLQVAEDIYGAEYDYVQWGWPWRTPVWFPRKDQMIGFAFCFQNGWPFRLPELLVKVSCATFIFTRIEHETKDNRLVCQQLDCNK